MRDIEAKETDMNTRNEYSQPPADAIEVEEPEYRPTWAFLVLVWGGLTMLGGFQGYYTGEAVITVLSWFGH